VNRRVRHGDREQEFREDFHTLRNTENAHVEEGVGLFEWDVSVFSFFLVFVSADHSFPIILLENHSE
jgi:hypothetical protein